MAPLHTICVLLVLSLACGGRDGEDSVYFTRLNPASWGGGWARADPKPETAQLFHPFAAWFDDRTQRLPQMKSKISGGAGDGVDQYVRILLTGQPEHLPSFFDNWDNKFLENMRKCTCLFTWEGNASLAAPVLDVVPSPMDYSWFPASFARPYAAYCPLPKERPKGGRGDHPIAVTLLPLNPQQPGGNNLFLPIHGREDPLSFLSSALRKQNSSTQQPRGSSPSSSSLALCVGPLSGPEYLTNDYDDVGAIISLLTYYSESGVSHIYLYNPILTHDHVSGESFHHWMHHLLYVLKKGSRGKRIALTVELVPDVARHRQRWHQTRHLDPDDRRHSAFLFSTLFPETCTHLAMEDKHSHLLIVDYNDFLLARDQGQGQEQVGSLLSLVKALDKEHPQAAVYEFSSAVLPDRPLPALSGVTSVGSSTTDAAQDQGMFAGCRDKDSHLADLLCKTWRTRPFSTPAQGGAADGGGRDGDPLYAAFARRRVLIRPERVDFVGHSAATPLAPFTTVAIPWGRASVLKYLEATYLRTPENSLRRDASSGKSVLDTRWLPAAQLPLAAVLTPDSAQGQGLGLEEEQGMTALRERLLNSTMHRFILHSFRPLELSHYSSLRQQALHPNPNSTLSADFGHPIPASASASASAPKTGSPSLRRLLLFTSLPSTWPSPSHFRRTQLTLSSWLALGAVDPRRLAVRVLVLADEAEACASLKRLPSLPGCRERGVPLNPFNSSSSSSASASGPGSASGSGDFVSAHHSSLLCLSVTHCRHPLYDVPTVDCLFSSASAAALPGEYLMYSNSDVAFGRDLVDALLALAAKPEVEEDGFAAVGRRWNCPFKNEDLCPSAVDSPPSTAASSASSSSSAAVLAGLFKAAQAGAAVQDTPFAIDYFILHPQAVPRTLAPFLVGRASWDNMLLWWLLVSSWGAFVPPEIFKPDNDTFIHYPGKGQVKAKEVLRGPPVVSLTEAVHALHLGAVDADMYDFSKRKGSDWAIRLLTDWYRMQVGNVDSSSFFLKANGDLRKRDYRLVFAPSPRPTPLPTLALAPG